LEVFVKKVLGFVVVLFLVAGSVLAQRGGAQQHRGNSGHIPSAPPARSQGGRPEVHSFPGGQVDGRPHVANDHWYGHDDRNDTRFHIAQPYAHGHFEHFGPSYQYRIGRFDLANHRFWFNGGFGFEVAAWDWPFAADWCWNCPDDIVVYDDPDHPGWYLIYNSETGVYVHAQYLGT
jgi:hypothetical protein